MKYSDTITGYVFDKLTELIKKKTPCTNITPWRVVMCEMRSHRTCIIYRFEMISLQKINVPGGLKAAQRHVY